MRTEKDVNKTVLAKSLCVSRSSLYYVSKKDEKDWLLKNEIETVMRDGHQGYGSRSLRDALHINRKRIRRVMRRYGIKPYRRRGRKWRKKKAISVVYPNLLSTTIPGYRHHVWAADFTELAWHKKTVYVATVIDLYTRDIVGLAMSLRKGAVLTTQALCAALLHCPRPEIFHSDNGKDYEARSFVTVLTNAGIRISQSHPGCPWENGYQESFYSKFKIDLCDPNRFETLGKLVAEVYRTIWIYNHTRIHSALRMPPRVFAEKEEINSLKTLRLAV